MKTRGGNRNPRQSRRLKSMVDGGSRANDPMPKETETVEIEDEIEAVNDVEAANVLGDKKLTIEAVLQRYSEPPIGEEEANVDDNGDGGAYEDNVDGGIEEEQCDDFETEFGVGAREDDNESDAHSEDEI
ncbi:unnamed protein product [Arabidopsis thaliana]|uniref:(thale cress) hypothetical protein n=1 Tax=Arabidopsis thaliana TaxID=3702 RepID=A0A7G2EU75_ARATH|nr:unnamed protein product [Arabidopsis thaliana]